MKKELGDAPLHLGGFLILLLIRLIGGIALNGKSILETFRLHLSPAGQVFRIMLILFILFAFYVSGLFSKRHKWFPGAYIGLEICSVIINLYTFLTAFDMNLGSGNVFIIPYTVALLLISILWILYIIFSKRVKKTFVFNWNESVDIRLAQKANGV